ncbi:class I SAM-dependent methyltransferase [Streptomyces sp. NPDC046831]|uniref:class I SAM-dependent DNA methyltransferase n=1 Tax=Streptomyces sp. NPDC046831 TaxID=3154805 RepID=UPI0034037C4E
MTDTVTDSDDFLTRTRLFYDTVAEDYDDHFGDHLARRPLDRALLTGFADLVAHGSPDGPVADLGCGPGRITAFLAGLGLPVFGVDLSQRMVELARRLHPGIRFEQGAMPVLDVPDGALAGAVAWYSVIHTPLDRVPGLFAELFRVLAPGGHLLVAFQAGDASLHLDDAFGHPVSLDFHRRRPDQMAELLEAAGFELLSRTVRERDPALGESTPQAFLTARRPPAAPPA